MADCDISQLKLANKCPEALEVSLPSSRFYVVHVFLVEVRRNNI